MNKDELIEALNMLAEGDLANDSDIFDHPCSVAIRALNQCFSDIEILRGEIVRIKQVRLTAPKVFRAAKEGKVSRSAAVSAVKQVLTLNSKQVRMLTGLSYGPTW